MLQKDDLCGTKPHLFTNKDVFPRLEELHLTHLGNPVAIWQGLPPSNSFIKLRVLKLDNCVQLSTAVPPDMIERLQDLESIEARNCDLLTEIFNFINPVPEQHSNFLPQLTKMTLTNLPALVHIWKICSPLAVCKNLKDLAISECEALEEIIPIKGQVNFQNLEVLQVINCNSLKSLCSISTARCFEQLQELKFYGCQKIEEILVRNGRDKGTGDDGLDEGTSGGNEGGASDRIMFPKLKCIILKKLPSLASFCSGSSAFEWPSLETVRVKDCLNMKTFAQEPQKTPKLKAVEVDFIHKIWKDDLNKTIQHLQQKNCLATP